MPGQIASLCKNYVGYPLPLGTRNVIKSVSLKLFTYLHVIVWNFNLWLVSHMLTNRESTRGIYLVLMNNLCSFRFVSLHFCEENIIYTVIILWNWSTDNRMLSKQDLNYKGLWGLVYSWCTLYVYVHTFIKTPHYTYILFLIPDCFTCKLFIHVSLLNFYW